MKSSVCYSGGSQFYGDVRQVVPVFAGGLDFSLPVRKFFYDPLGSGKAFVDCVVSLTGFALVGGPARQDAPKVHICTLNYNPSCFNTLSLLKWTYVDI